MFGQLVRAAGSTLAMTGLVAVLAGSAPAGVLAASPTPPFDPTNFGGPIDNAWFPLTPGTTLAYRGTKDGKQATDIFHITHRTRRIQGVACVVVEVAEITDRGPREELRLVQVIKP